MNQQIAYNTTGWKIRTDEGFVEFDGVAQMGIKSTYELGFDDNSTVGATATHCFYTADGREIPVREMEVGIELLGIDNRTVTSIEYVGKEQTYDIINSATHTFFVNGLLAHNCEFISNDPLLIDTICLANLTNVVKDINPVGVSGELVFYKQPQANMVYLVGMDPATGSMSDFTAIVAYEFPSLEQVAEFRSNTSSSVAAYHMLKKLLRIFEKAEATVYYSVEVNGVGESIISLMEADETPPETAEFISETGQKRRGMTTTGKSKIKACLTFKEMVERSTMQIKSKALVAEMKQFVRKAGSYAAKPGGTDDLVMASLIAIRLLEEISTFDQDAYDKLYSHAFFEESNDGSSEYDDNDEGMGMIFS